MQKDVINSSEQFVDIKPGQSNVNTRQEAPVANTTNVTEMPRQETSPAPTEKQDDRPQILGKRIGFELGLGSSVLVESVFASLPNSDIADLNSDTGGIVYSPIKIQVDLIYAEMSGYLLSGYGGVQRNAHILGKYPIDIGLVKVSPLVGYSYNMIPDAISLIQTDKRDPLMPWLPPQYTEITKIGFEDNQFTFGNRVEVGLNKFAYLSTEYLYSTSAGSNAQSFKISGGGFTAVGFGVRLELMYQYTRTVYNDKATMSGTIPEVSMEGSKYENSRHFFGLYLGLGYNWRVGKESRPTAEAIPASPPIQAPETSSSSVPAASERHWRQ